MPSLIRPPRPVVYIAGPYTSGDTVANVAAACTAGHLVRDWGGIPVVPHTSTVWDAADPRPYRYWLDLCLDLIANANIDLIWRIPGESPGADEEVALAEGLGIRVVVYDFAFKLYRR